MGIFNNPYNSRWDEFREYTDRNGSEPDPVEYDRLSTAVDREAAHTPWWRRI
jgi:hypothetical protein